MLASRAKRVRSTGPLRVLFDNLYHYATPITTYVLPCAVNLGNVTAILTLQTPLLLLMCWRCRRYNLFMSACHSHCAYDRRSVSPTAVHAFEAGYLVARFTVSSQGGIGLVIRCLPAGRAWNLIPRPRHPTVWTKGDEHGRFGYTDRHGRFKAAGRFACTAIRINTAASAIRINSGKVDRCGKPLLISRLPTAARGGQGIKGSSLTADLREASRASTCSQCAFTAVALRTFPMDSATRALPTQPTMRHWAFAQPSRLLDFYDWRWCDACACARSAVATVTFFWCDCVCFRPARASCTTCNGFGRTPRIC